MPKKDEQQQFDLELKELTPTQEFDKLTRIEQEKLLEKMEQIIKELKEQQEQA